MRWLWCVIFHRWIRYRAVRYSGAENYDSELEDVTFCPTCGRDR